MAPAIKVLYLKNVNKTFLPLAGVIRLRNVKELKYLSSKWNHGVALLLFVWWRGTHGSSKSPTPNVSSKLFVGAGYAYKDSDGSSKSCANKQNSPFATSKPIE